MDSLVKETKNYYDRVRNTYHYTICSRNCPIKNDVGDFSFTIPPFPYPDHQGSQIGVFSLKEAYVCNQGTDAGDRASGDVDKDVSGLYVSFAGLGFRPQNYTNFGAGGTTGEPSSRQFFTVINEDGGSDNSTSNIYQRVSGGKAIELIVPVSNPAGTQVSCKVLDMDDTAELVGANLYTIVHFTIELIPTEVSNGM
jgi:hypothetical protein